MIDPTSVPFRGPLTPYALGLWSDLKGQGYPPASGAKQLRLAAHLSRWLDDRELDTSDLTIDRVQQFLADRRREGHKSLFSLKAMQPLLGYLRRVGAAPPPTPLLETAVDHFVRSYADYLASERGLLTPTIQQYTTFARCFIQAEFDGNVPDWSVLDASFVTDFVSREIPRLSLGTRRMTVTGLRSLLRYLNVSGHLAHEFLEYVPSVAGWRLSSLPKGLDPKQVEELLASRDTRSRAGVRDRAVLCLLARLGLRAGEVAALELADIDWRAGEIVIRGKPRRESRLPVPLDVGRALVKYLRQRPRVESRGVFLRIYAPHRPIGPGAVSGLAGRALRAIGVGSGSAHLLRHTAATQMLRSGASLAEIGHVLRHRHIDTTAIYAKVDHAALRTLAQPWPGGVA